MTESLPAPEPSQDAEAASARVVFRELDKAWRATRTYGISNAVTKRFFEQLQNAMLDHLKSWPVLAVVVDRAELRLYEQVVYRSEDSLGESLAFRLYGDGVREVRFDQGVMADDLLAFLDALWGASEEDEDDDVVTRLWAKELETISFVTAEDILQAPYSEELRPQEHGFFQAPPASFSGVIDREKKLSTVPAATAGAGPVAAGENLDREKPSSGMVGFEVSGAERKELEAALTVERAVDGTAQVLAMLDAILRSERAPDILNRGLATIPPILDVLLAGGSWTALSFVLETLEQAAQANPAFELTHSLLAQRVLESLNLPERVWLIEKGLATEEGRGMAGLPGVFARLHASAVGPLCLVLANLTDEEQRAALRDTLIRLGPENPEPVLKGLADPRPQYVRDLITIIVAWQQPQAKDVLAMAVAHPVPEVRADAIASIARLHPSGEGGPVLAFASDKDREVRAHALRLLASGRYTATWEQWRPHLRNKEETIELARADKRLLFQALRASAGDGAAQFWMELLTGRGWKNRAKREETALLAIKALASLDSQAGRDALEFGRKQGSGTIRKACAAALAGKGD